MDPTHGLVGLYPAPWIYPMYPAVYSLPPFPMLHLEMPVARQAAPAPAAATASATRPSPRSQPSHQDSRKRRCHPSSAKGGGATPPSPSTPCQPCSPAKYAKVDTSCAWALVDLASGGDSGAALPGSVSRHAATTTPAFMPKPGARETCGTAVAPPPPPTPSAPADLDVVLSAPVQPPALADAAVVDTAAGCGVDLLPTPLDARRVVSPPHGPPSTRAAAGGDGAAPRTRCTAHVFLAAYRERFAPQGTSFLDFVVALSGPLRPTSGASLSQLEQTCVDMMRTTRTCAKFVLRKLASAILPTISSSRREALHDRLALPDLPAAENAWTKADAVHILRQVCARLPHLARIPVDLRTSSSEAPGGVGAPSDSVLAVGGAVGATALPVALEGSTQ